MDTFPDERADRLLIAGILFAILVVIALLVLAVTEVSRKERQVTTARVHATMIDHSTTAQVAHRTPAAQEVQVRLTRALSSDASAVRDRFSANVVTPVRIGEGVVIDEGATMTGRGVEVVRSKKIGGTARLAIAFDRLRLDSGTEVPIDATIGGATAGGALLGRIIGHDRGNEADGTAIGAIVGAAVGTAIAASNQGEAVVLPEGAVLEVRLDTPVDLEIG